MSGRGTWCALLMLGLGACSSVPNAVNPIAWYRDLSGASKNDDLDKDQRNEQNLQAGSKEPYPNLATVPNAPDRAISSIDREKLQKSLVADRQNAQYTADQLQAGAPVPGAVAPPPPAPAEPAAKPEPKAPRGKTPAPTPAAPAPTAQTPAPAEPAAPLPAPRVPVAAEPAPNVPAAAGPAPAEATAAAPPDSAPAAAPLPAAVAAATPPAAPPPAATAPIVPPVAAQPATTPPVASAAPVAAAPQRSAAPPQRGSEEPPTESQLASPAVRSLPEGEAPGAPPPPPNIPPSPIATTAASRGAATETAALSRTTSAPAAARQVGEIGFADGSAVLTGDARGKLNDIAALQHQGGGALRVVGHSEPQAGKDAVQQRIDGLALALDRAKAVAQALSAAGVPANDIVVEAAPTRASETPRAEIFILR